MRYRLYRTKTGIKNQKPHIFGVFGHQSVINIVTGNKKPIPVTIPIGSDNSRAVIRNRGKLKFRYAIRVSVSKFWYFTIQYRYTYLFWPIVDGKAPIRVFWLSQSTLILAGLVYLIVGKFPLCRSSYYLRQGSHCPTFHHLLGHLKIGHMKRHTCTVTLQRFLLQCCVFQTTLQQKFWRVTVHICQLLHAGLYIGIAALSTSVAALCCPF
jgi:hypothetical protein